MSLLNEYQNDYYTEYFSNFWFVECKKSNDNEIEEGDTEH